MRELPETPEVPPSDPNYINNGFQIFVHHGTGYYPDRKVRVAVCLQYKKDIVLDEEGTLCFYATSGKNPNTKLVKGEPDNTEMGDVIVWHENKTFRRDFFKYLWD